MPSVRGQLCAWTVSSALAGNHSGVKMGRRLRKVKLTHTAAIHLAKKDKQLRHAVGNRSTQLSLLQTPYLKQHEILGKFGQ